MGTIIYALYKNNIPFYVGKTKDSKHRLNMHRYYLGKDIEMKELDIIPSTNKIDWKPYEQAWIELYRSWGYKLTNKNIGGGGPLPRYDDGLTSNQRHYLRNKEKQKEKSKIWRQNNKERANEIWREHYQNKKIKKEP